jgi:multiple sugar transport system permease protein
MSVEISRNISSNYPRRANKSSDKNLLARILLNLILYAIGLAILFPFIWMLITAVKPTPEIIAIPFKWLPSHITIDHFLYIFQFAPFGLYMTNSLIITVASTLFDVFVAAIVGYGFAKFRFYGSNALFMIILTGLMIPFSIRLLPLYRLILALGLSNTRTGVVLPNFTSILGIFLMRQFLLSFPSEIQESGRLDGASEPRIFFSLVFANTIPMLAAVGIFKFVYYWNDFLWPLVVINSETKRTITIGLAMYVGRNYLEYGPFMAAAMTSIVPIIVVSVALQRYIIKGVVLTGLKG